MRLTRKEKVEAPIHNEAGEVIYDLVGAPEAFGGAKRHSFAIVVIPPGGSSARHHHEIAEETYYILRGAARLVVDGQAFTLNPGDACFIEPPERHQIFNDGGEELEFIVVCAPPWTPDVSTYG